MTKNSIQFSFSLSFYATMFVATLALARDQDKGVARLRAYK
jgi:hypothetical protein